MPLRYLLLCTGLLLCHVMFTATSARVKHRKTVGTTARRHAAAADSQKRDEQAATERPRRSEPQTRQVASASPPKRQPTPSAMLDLSISAIGRAKAAATSIRSYVSDLFSQEMPTESNTHWYCKFAGGILLVFCMLSCCAHMVEQSMTSQKPPDSDDAEDSDEFDPISQDELESAAPNPESAAPSHSKTKDKVKPFLTRQNSFEKIKEGVASISFSSSTIASQSKGVASTGIAMGQSLRSGARKGKDQAKQLAAEGAKANGGHTGMFGVRDFGRGLLSKLAPHSPRADSDPGSSY